MATDPDKLEQENKRLREQNARLLAALEEMRSKLTEQGEIVRAIRQGEIDSLVVGEHGQERIYSLQTLDSAYRSMVEEHFPYGVWLAESGGKLLYVSPSFLDLLKTDLERMNTHGQFHFLPPAVREAVECQWSKGREAKESCQAEYTIRLDDGSERTIWTHGLLIHTLTGQARWVGVNLDVTEQRKVRDDLRQQAEALRLGGERSRLLSEAAAVLLHADDPNAMLRTLFAKIGPHLGLDSYFNFMVDETGEELRLASCIGIPEETARSIERLEFGEAICGTVDLHRQPIVATCIQQSDDPKAQLVRSFGIRAYACTPLMVGDRLLGTLSFASRSRDKFDADELEFLQTICRYVTAAYERLRLIQQLRKGDRRKDDFLATLAHELRNPLAPIRNALELLRRADNDNTVREHARSLMERQLQRMVRLIDDLLDISRITRGKVQLRKEQVQLAVVVQSAVEASRPHVESHDHQLSVTLPPEPVYLDADPTRLAQVFANLLDNAAKYTEKGGQVWLTAKRQGSDVMVSVKDTGIGIPAEHLPNIFEMFSQVAPALERSQGGLGIGLSLVKGLVELHGGGAEARSEGHGKGSEFIIRLPVAEAPVRAVPTPSSNGEQHRCLWKCRILVVDDNRDAADSLAMMLKMMGHDSHTAYDGLEAVQAAAFRPDVVLLDIGLPKMNGYEAARHIRQQTWGKNMVLIAVTGWGQEEDRRRSQEAGFDHHIVKPVDPNALMNLLAGLNGVKR